MLLGKAVDRLHVRVANLTECGRRWNLKVAPPSPERTDLSHRLQLRYIGLQKDPVNGAILERDVISQ
jgi:hypothetical protein